MKKCVVIPTYWGPIDDNEEIVFDHPTPLEGKGTLERTLQNLSQYEAVRKGTIPVRIVGVANKRAIRDEAEKILSDYINPFGNQMDIKLCSYGWLDRKREQPGDEALSFNLLSPESYSQIRNICLLAALETGADIGIFLDDDEILIDDDFFDIAQQGIYERAHDNGLILAKAGYYEQERPSYRNFWELKWWPKDVSFNTAFERLMRKTPRFKPSMVGLGGNMVITHEVMKEICFDPLVNRGEDMDYVLNARFRGFRFYFDPRLRIKHLPPEKKTPHWKKAREDIYRFLFMRDKYNSHWHFDAFQKIPEEELMPYPGVFLKDDLEERIYQHNNQLSLKYLAENDKEGFEKCMENCRIPFVYEKREDASQMYYDRLIEWGQLLKRLV